MQYTRFSVPYIMCAVECTVVSTLKPKCAVASPPLRIEKCAAESCAVESCAEESYIPINYYFD